jgi:hypothetical protein
MKRRSSTTGNGEGAAAGFSDEVAEFKNLDEGG